MKKLLLAGATVSIISIITYFSLPNIANWWVAKKDGQERQQRASEKDTLPYIKNQYIITMPTNQDSMKALITFLEKKGLKKFHDCGCSQKVELWGADPNLADILIDLQPDTDPPPPGFMMPVERLKKDTASKPAKSLSYNYSGPIITRNYKLVEPMTYQKVVKPLEANPKRYPQPKSDAPKVIVATVDSGVDPTVPGINPSLYRNTATSYICQPPKIEGVFGWNVLNQASDVEPIETDEQCYGIFSVRNGHGTLINGIIAGMGWYPTQTDFTNDANVNIQLLNIRIVNQGARQGSLFDALCGINYALEKGAKVINISWRLSLFDVHKPSVKAIFRSTMSRLKDSSAMMVACAGNDGIKNNPNLEIWPAAFSRDVDFKDNVIAVGGWNSEAAVPGVAPTSNQANFVDVYAPSMGIRMYNRIPAISWWQCLFTFDLPQRGTSFATPFITREVALRMANPSLLPATIKAQLVTDSSPTTTPNVIIFPPPAT